MSSIGFNYYSFEYGRFNNFKDVSSRFELMEDELFDLANKFDNLHGRVLNNEVRTFNRGEHSRYYSNKDNCIEFKVPTSIIIYWNHKPVFYFHRTNELIYIPKALAKKIMDTYDTVHHENTPDMVSPYISTINLEHIYGWDSKYINDNWSHVNIIE